MIKVADFCLTFDTEAEMDKAVEVANKVWLSDTCDSIDAYFNKYNGKKVYYMHVEDEITIDELNDFMKKWEEQNS